MFPGTPAGRVFREWFESFNSGCHALMHEFCLAHGPIAGSIDQAIGLYRTTGGFDMVRVEEASKYRLSVILQERLSDTLVRADLLLARRDRHEIERLSFNPIRRPKDLSIRRLSMVGALASVIDRADWLARIVFLGLCWWLGTATYYFIGPGAWKTVGLAWQLR